MDKPRRTTKKHEPTQKTQGEVELLASFGIPHDEISKYIEIDKKTLYKYYRTELDKAKLKAHGAVGQFLFRAASGMALKDKDLGASYSDCIRAAMFYAKTRMKWRETDGDEIPQGAVVNVTIENDGS